MKLASTVVTVLGMATLLFWGCESENKENPEPPGDTILNESDAVAVQPEGPSEPTEVPDIPVATENEEGVITLNVVPNDQLPARLKTCLDQGVAGEVTNGSFACNQQAVQDCNELSDGQKLAAKTYSDENIPGYGLWACSVDADENPNLHFYNIEGVALKIFNLAVQKAEPVDEVPAE